MRTKMIVSLLTMVLLSTIACNDLDAVNKNQDNPEGDHPVKTLYLTSIEALNEGNLDLFLDNFAPDIKMYGTDGIYFGQTALRQRFETVLQQYPEVRMEIPELDLEILGQDIVLVNFEWKVFPMGQGPAFSGIGSGVYVKERDTWMEILEVETITAVDEALKQN